MKLPKLHRRAKKQVSITAAIRDGEHQLLHPTIIEQARAKHFHEAAVRKIPIHKSPAPYINTHLPDTQAIGSNGSIGG